MGLVNAKDLSFDYIRRDEDGNVEGIVAALDHVNINIKEGQIIAIIGSNGSGKSTFAKHINAILTPTEGTIYVDGMDTREDAEKWNIRQKAGMVFQNPDNQIIGNTVEEDVGFGPENLGVPTKEIWERVLNALESVGMTAYSKQSPNRLSGGQKQRVAIAGIMAMKPKCIIMDEATSMLDPGGRREVMDAVIELNRKENITVILITHFMEEAVFADRIFVMEKGKIAMEGKPREIFSQVDELSRLRLGVPQATRIANDLAKAGFRIPKGILTNEELVEAICQLY